LDDHIKEKVTAGPCSTHWGDEKYTVLLECLKGRDHSEDLGVDKRINFKMNLWKIA
jgi:hypothetical protein